MTRPRSLAASAILLLASLGGASSASVRAARGQFVVNGERLYLTCAGAGRPTVVLDAGLGGDHREWMPVQTALAHTTRVCSWDRPGLGRSPGSAITRPSTPAGSARLLHDLLRAARITGPLLVAGHSTGGLDALEFRRLYPRSVAGLAFLESTPLAELSAGPRTISFGPERERLPPPSELRVVYRFPRSLPLVIVERGEDRDRSWEAAQAALSRRSTDVLLVQADHSDHDLPARQPALVSATLTAAANHLRVRDPLPSCAPSLRLLGGTCLRAGTIPPIPTDLAKSLLPLAALALVATAAAIRTRRRRRRRGRGGTRNRVG